MRKPLLLAGAATLFSTAAMAADMPMAAPVYKAAPVAVEEVGSGWYLRGDIGFSNQEVKNLDNPAYHNPASGILTQTFDGVGFDAAPLADIGVGVRWNDWLRFDVLGQYRGSANFHGSESGTFNAGGTAFSYVDNYTARKSEWLFLANAYVDLGTWWCVTPFIGAGVGTAQVNIKSFRDDGHNAFGTATAYFADSSSWNFAWAMHAGLAYKVTPGMTVELAYHYVNMGDGHTGLPRQFDNSSPGTVGAFTFNNITSQDVTLGVRWQFDQPVAMPLSRRG
jgi:opacity protein-like surface antigen